MTLSLNFIFETQSFFLTWEFWIQHYKFSLKGAVQ
jgi:hypothetical protein